MRPIFRLLPWLLACALLPACSSNGGGESPAPEARGPAPDAKLALKRFTGAAACGDLERYLGESFAESFLTPFRCFGIGPCAFLDVAFGAPQPAPAAPGVGMTDGEAAGPRSPDRVSGTHTQEAGVDEADLVKADGAGRLYLVAGDRLRILAAFPPEGLADRPLVELPLAGEGQGRFTARELLLEETRGQVVVLGERWGAGGMRAESVLVDVRDPAAPRITGRLAVDGFSLEARRVGQRVHRFGRFDPQPPAAIFEDSGLLRLRDDYFRALDRGRAAEAAGIKAEVVRRITTQLRADGVESVLPRRHDGDRATPLPCDAVVAPEVPTHPGLAVLQSFDLDGGNHALSAAVNNAYLLYVSEQNLYLAQNSVGWFFSPDQPDETVIHRFALSATGAPAYRGLGRVPGSPPNRFAFSEHAGHLRVATTAASFDGRAARFSNHLQVLRLAAEGLTQVGAVDGYAPGETTRGVRFLGDRGFVVTFEQVDPLFAFDLSNPARPTILSELKIPGFSSHLQPLGRDLLLTIGRGGDEEQLNGRVAVQLFDVSDLRAVRQMAVIEPQAGDGSYSYSSAEYDARAFTYFPDAETAPVPGTLAVPLRVFDRGRDFAGFMVIRVDPASQPALRELARVDHAGLAEGADCSPGRPGGAPDAAPPAGEAATVAPRPCGAAFIDPLRTVFMQDAAGTFLYSLSSHGLVAVDAADPARERGRRALPPVLNDCMFCRPAPAPAR